MAYDGLAADFYNSLARRPYCSDNIKHGVRVMPQRLAVRYPYLQYDRPGLRGWLVFDIDRHAAFGRWDDAGLPTPNIAVINGDNQRGHLYYRLATPVCTSAKGRTKPQDYLEAINDAYIDRLDADPCFTQFVAKNPLSPAYRTAWLHDKPFPLTLLADYVELAPRDKREAHVGIVAVVGFRNQTLFDTLREWAYSAIRARVSREAWGAACLRQAERINQSFPQRLPMNEVHHTARSIAKGTWKHRAKLAAQCSRGRDGHGPTRHDDYDPYTEQYHPSGLPLLPEAEVKRRRVMAAHNTHAARRAQSTHQIETGILTLRNQTGIQQPNRRAIAAASGVSLGCVNDYFKRRSLDLPAAQNDPLDFFDAA